MRRALFTTALLAAFGAAAACGGGAAKKDVKSGGDVTYEDEPGKPVDPVDPGQPEDPPQDPVAGDPTTEPEPEKPPEPKKPKEQPKPPGEDLTDAEKGTRIAKGMKAAQEATRKEDADGMIREALDILTIDQTNLDAMVILAHGYFLKGWDDKAEGVLEEAKKRRPDAADKHAKRWMLLALIYDRSTRANHEDLALMAYSTVVKLDPRYARAYTNRGVIYLRRKAFLVTPDDGPQFGAVLDFEAVDELELGAQLTGDDRRSCTCKTAATCAHLGAAYRGQSADKGASRDELLVQAERCFKNSMAKNANYAPAYFGLGVLYLDADPFPGKEKIKRLQDAITYLKQYEAKARPLKPDAQKVYDNYVSSAQKAVDFEQKMLEKKKQREEEKRKKEAEKKKKEAEGGAKPEGG